jgi:hypothetical protein
MDSNQDFKKLLSKIEELKKSGNFDLSLEEDLSIAIMNLISLEEHFFFTSQKTGKSDYLKLLDQTREIRKKLLGRMIDKHEGETWCISKHLLAASMRLMEVGTKLQTDGKTSEAEEMFRHSYEVYSLFWGLRLKLIDTKNIKKIPDPPTNQPWQLSDLVTQLVDCCKE